MAYLYTMANVSENNSIPISEPTTVLFSSSPDPKLHCNSVKIPETWRVHWEEKNEGPTGFFVELYRLYVPLTEEKDDVLLSSWGLC